MPLYDFQCDNCQNVFEVRATFKEKENGLEPECPRCSAVVTHQLLAAGQFVVKGGDGASLPVSSCGSCGGGSCGSCGH